MKSTWFGNRKRYDFARLLHEADYGMQHYDTFRAFLTMAEVSLRQGVRRALGMEICPELEERYMREVRRIKHPTKICEAMAILVDSLEDHWHDFLGKTMTELEINDSRYKGQCFTPEEVSRCMAQMTLADVGPPVPGRTLMLHEPCCGGGVMAIVASDELRKKGYFPWDYFWQCVDVDQKCFQMTYIQLTLLGIPAAVIWGNSITLEQWDSATTLVGVLHPPKRQEEESAPVPGIVAPEPEAILVRQLELF